MDFIKKPTLKETPNLLFLDKINPFINKTDDKETVFDVIKNLANSQNFAKDLDEIDLSKLIESVPLTNSPNVKKLFIKFYREIVPNADIKEINVIYNLLSEKNLFEHLPLFSEKNLFEQFPLFYSKFPTVCETIEQPFYSKFPTYCQAIGLSSLADNFSSVFNNQQLTQKDKNILSIIYLVHFFSLLKNPTQKVHFFAIYNLPIDDADINEPLSKDYLNLNSVQLRLLSTFHIILPYVPFTLSKFLAKWHNCSFLLNEPTALLPTEELQTLFNKAFGGEKTVIREYLPDFYNPSLFSSAQLLFAKNSQCFSFETLASFGEKLIFLHNSETDVIDTNNRSQYKYFEEEYEKLFKDLKNLNHGTLRKAVENYSSYKNKKLKELHKKTDDDIAERYSLSEDLEALSFLIKDIVYFAFFPFGLCAIFSKLNKEEDKSNKAYYLEQLFNNCYSVNLTKNKNLHFKKHISELCLNTLFVLEAHKKDISSVSAVEKNFSHYLKESFDNDNSFELLNLARMIAFDKLLSSQEEFSIETLFVRRPELENYFLKKITKFFLPFEHFEDFCMNHLGFGHKPHMPAKEEDVINNNVIERLGNSLVLSYKSQCLAENVVKNNKLDKKLRLLFKLLTCFDKERTLIPDEVFFKLLHLSSQIEHSFKNPIEAEIFKQRHKYSRLFELFVYRLIPQKNSHNRFANELEMGRVIKLLSFVKVLFNDFIETKDIDTWLNDFSLAENLAKETEETDVRYSKNVEYLTRLLEEIFKFKETFNDCSNSSVHIS